MTQLRIKRVYIVASDLGIIVLKRGRDSLLELCLGV